jgi:catechol 2,3-dioxygenase-like lactoylglutathione lyase family enzyme
MAVTRYVVENVDRSIRFYADHFGFELQERYGPFVAVMGAGDQTVWLSGPRSSAGQRTEDGAQPEPGGWSRIVLEVQDLEAEVDRLRAGGVRFRGEAVKGPAGSWVLLEDDSGNPIELFQPA